MSKTSMAASSLSSEARSALHELGINIQTARKKRRWRQKDLAERCLTTIPTIRKLEKGEPTVQLGILIQALSVLGMTSHATELADPSRDEVGMGMEISNAPKRIRSIKNKNNLDF